MINYPTSICFSLFIIFGLLLALPEGLYAQKNDRRSDAKKSTSADGEYYGERIVDYTTRIYDNEIQTVILHSSASELEPPIIMLNGAEQIVVRFDDLSETMRDMSYTIEHCTYDWKKSDLQRMDYSTGFNADVIYDYEFSFNTLRNYTHYNIAVPNDRINLTRSGNYVLKVWANGDEDNVMFVARFMVVEPLVIIEETIRPSSVVSERRQKQEIDLTVQLNGISSMNPYAEIELILMQNFRWDNERRGVKPSFIKDNVLTYDYQRELTFEGGNEYRFFDAKSVRYRSEQVAEVKLQDGGYHIYLSPDKRRAFKQYNFNNDINGRFLIKNDDMQNAHLESDYVMVHFSMPVDAMIGSGNMYLMGQLSNWTLDKNYRMEYNPSTLAYEKMLMLKQGYYNYLYLWQGVNAGEGSPELTEGNHSEAENEYIALIYFKDRSTFADRLVGFKKFSNFSK
jgi:predicted aspartyl protease